MKLIIENQYFTCINVIKNSIKYKNIVFEQYENFQKNSFRNRCIILGSNGLHSLTVPLIGGREQKSTIKRLAIDNSQNWQKDHWKGIVSAYGKASFFEFYEKAVHDLINDRFEYLWELNIEIFNWVIYTLKVEVAVSVTESYVKDYLGELDLRNRVLPKNFQNHPAGWKPRYFQVFSDRHGFQPNLSILDLIFNEGPNAKNLLMNSIE